MPQSSFIRATLTLAISVAGNAAALSQQAFASPSAGSASTPASQPAAPDEITLERLMADPEWMGARPQDPYWADDGRSFYWHRKIRGVERRELIESDLDGHVLRVLDEDAGDADDPGGDYSRDYAWKVYARNGDVFLKQIATGRVQQLTRTVAAESAPRFLVGDERIQFRRGSDLFIRDLKTGLEYQPAELRFEKDPAEKKDEADFLREQQERLFDVLRERKQRREEQRKREQELRRTDATRVPPPWHLGDERELREASLSPAGRWLLLRLAKKGRDGKRDTMASYVSESGYVETQQVRGKVGTSKPIGDELLLLDVETHEQHALDLSVLPAISDDPLRELRARARERRRAQTQPATQPAESRPATRAANHLREEDESEDDVGPAQQRAKRRQRAERTATAQQLPPETPESESPPASAPAEEEESDKPRPVQVRDVVWSRDGQRVVLQVLSLDNKDRWLATVDLAEHKLVPLEHWRDEAWINERFAELGWLLDNETIYFLSEEDGWSHLYLRSVSSDKRRRLTSGRYEVSDVSLSRDGQRLYYTANATHPGVYEAYRIEIASGRSEQISRLGGRNRILLSPDEQTLLVQHSSSTRPPELYLHPLRPGAEARRVTSTTSDEFLRLPWVEPQIVEVPSPGGGTIYARLYAPPEQPRTSVRAAAGSPRTAVGASDALGATRPAVMFVHGAGYLQNAHQGWSTYEREFMFHSLLAYRGYVVLDMDYRGSAGYGRDWRTAIYRDMGGPELEDLEAGVRWLADNARVDPVRVGVYGGSYGGFLTLMALFRKPELFACGAALRPVTDWAHYNHGYTSNILNVPQIDPETYARSSPIEFAAGLKRPLLLCHGMQDDNVFFQDTVRLAQRLIELGKQDWEVALYPVESHGFREPSSWLDEYRRILKLFETHLAARAAE